MLNNTTSPLKISFIGGGNMATALISGLCDQSAKALCRPGDIQVVDISAQSLQNLHDRFGIKTSQCIDEQVSESNVVLLAVKPQQMREVAEKLAPFIKNQLVISIAAGIRFQDLSHWLNNYDAIVRTMPNMPALINQGITGIYAAPGVSNEQRAVADSIMKAVGSTVWLNDEALLDPLTALSGSGPAYVFYFIEAMQNAAQEMGFTNEQGRQLAMATFLGASQLADQSSESVTTLRERVTSKGGTTHAAISSMEHSGIAERIIKAVKAASMRSKELGDEFGG